jgi:hypothetical protein
MVSIRVVMAGEATVSRTGIMQRCVTQSCNDLPSITIARDPSFAEFNATDRTAILAISDTSDQKSIRQYGWNLFPERHLPRF